MKNPLVDAPREVASTSDLCGRLLFFRTIPHRRWGKPVRLSESEESQLQADGQNVVVLLDHSDRRFHSTCGNRFRWNPPHAKARQSLFRVREGN
jgi:hypothetical protein